MKLTVNTQPSYEIIIENGCLLQIGKRAKALLPKAERAVVVTDSNVGPFYVEKVKQSLQNAGFAVFIKVFPAGEQSKNLAVISSFYEAFSKAGLTRTDFAVALGGGVCGDMTGFAAATWLRGIPFIQVPTTLLSQVDSSVGGKTGVDLPEGKNLVGAFHQPALVLVDPETLATLTPAFFADGMGEVIKYGCIRDKALFDRLAKEDCHGYLAEMIYTCVNIKRQVVEHDEFDTGERAILNFGHTFGHALERVQDYCGLSHGKAVGVGMVLMAQVGERAGLTKAGTSEKIAALLQKYGLPASCDEALETLLPATVNDKKSSGSSINLIFLKTIGECFIQNISRKELPRLCGVQP